jgi:hypothetical protein
MSTGTTMAVALRPPEYPEICNESDSCAIDNQKKYFRLFKLKIGLLIAVSIVTSVSSSTVLEFAGLGLVIAIALLALMFLTAVIELRRYDRIWFSSRAIAESVKKESWLFMMEAKPYNNTDIESAVRIFLANLRKVIDSQSQISSELSTHLQDSPQITAAMKEIRNQSIAGRLNIYLTHRVHDQCVWYTSMSKLNRDLESKWFVLTWIFQFLAVSFAFIVFLLNNPVINPVGILTTTAAGVISWMSVRSYRELSQSYGLIKQELSLLEEQAKQLPPKTEEELGEFVQEVERTISREHTIWLSRRTVR